MNLLYFVLFFSTIYAASIPPLNDDVIKRKEWAFNDHELSSFGSSQGNPFKHYLKSFYNNYVVETQQLNKEFEFNVLFLFNQMDSLNKYLETNEINDKFDYESFKTNLIETQEKIEKIAIHFKFKLDSSINWCSYRIQHVFKKNLELRKVLETFKSKFENLRDKLDNGYQLLEPEYVLEAVTEMKNGNKPKSFLERFTAKETKGKVIKQNIYASVDKMKQFNVKELTELLNEISKIVDPTTFTQEFEIPSVSSIQKNKLQENFVKKDVKQYKSSEGQTKKEFLKCFQEYLSETEKLNEPLEQEVSNLFDRIDSLKTTIESKEMIDYYDFQFANPNLQEALNKVNDILIQFNFKVEFAEKWLGIRKTNPTEKKVDVIDNFITIKHAEFEQFKLKVQDQYKQLNKELNEILYMISELTENEQKKREQIVKQDVIDSMTDLKNKVHVKGLTEQLKTFYQQVRQMIESKDSLVNKIFRSFTRNNN